MNTVDTQKPRRLVGLLMGLALLAAVILVAWLSIKLVNNVPGSFASLASLAQSVQNYQNSATGSSTEPVVNTESDAASLLIVTSDTNVVMNGSEVRLNWTEARTPGSYVFSYMCTEGIAIDLNEASGVRNLSCDTNYNLGKVNTAVLTVASEKERFVDINYSLGFLATNDVTPRVSTNGTVTAVNNQIPLATGGSAVVVATTTPAVTAPEPTAPSVTPTPTPKPTTPTFTQEYTYTIPVSNPNGRTDLSIRYLGVGRIDNNRFVTDTLDNDTEGAIQFEVKNLGSKTSGTWSYSITLPTGGTYESDNEPALKPNERAVITIGFGESSVTKHTFTAIVTASGDSTSVNNQFKQAVTLRD